jgi:hypothetical protein
VAREPTKRGPIEIGSAQSHRRRRSAVPRPNRVSVTYSDEEWQRVTASAAAARLAVAAWIAETSLAPRRSTPGAPLSGATAAGTAASERQEMLLQLLGIHRQLRGACTNLNQAVAKLNALGQPDADLAAVAAYVRRVTTSVDETVAAVRMRR